MLRVIRPLQILAFILTSGCIFQNISAEEKLRDAVVGYNDETRWSRLDLAQQRVTPTKRGEFRLMHHRWGREIQIADMDILDVQVRGEEQDNATSIVQIRWYDQRAMLFNDTIVSQEWERVTGGYILTSETVRDGNAELLAIPPELRPEAADEESLDTPAEPSSADTDESAQATLAQATQR